MNIVPVKQRNIKCTVDCVWRRGGMCAVYYDLRGCMSKNTEGRQCLTFTSRRK